MNTNRVDGEGALNYTCLLLAHETGYYKSWIYVDFPPRESYNFIHGINALELNSLPKDLHSPLHARCVNAFRNVY